MLTEDRRSLFQALLGDGRPFLTLTGTALCASGGFAIFQSLSGHLLPHDSRALGMDAAGLAHLANRHLTLFMFHDRVAFALYAKSNTRKKNIEPVDPTASGSTYR